MKNIYSAIASDDCSISTSNVGYLGAIFVAVAIKNGFKLFNKVDTLEEEIADLHRTNIKINRYQNRVNIYKNILNKYDSCNANNVLTTKYMTFLINKKFDSIEALHHNLEMKSIILNNIEISKKVKS